MVLKRKKVEGYLIHFKEKKESVFIVAPDEQTARKHFLAQYPDCELHKCKKCKSWLSGKALKEGSITKIFWN